MRRLRTLQNATAVFAFTLLAIEFLDEFVFGAREAAWPLIRDDLGLSYAQIGLLLGLPNVIANFIEPALGILGVMGLVAEQFGLGVTMWLLLLGPVALLVGIPRQASVKRDV